MVTQGRMQSEQKVIETFFAGMPVVDAKHDLNIYPLQCDIDAAVPGDPENCVFARSLQRTMQAEAVVFWKTVAIVSMPDRNGKMRAVRFRLSPQMRAAIVAFDKTGEASVEDFILKAPSPGQTLVHLRKQKVKERQRAAEQQKNGEIPVPAATTGNRKKAARDRVTGEGTISLVRSGSGHPQLKHTLVLS